MQGHGGFLALVDPELKWRREVSPELPAIAHQADLVWEVEGDGGQPCLASSLRSREKGTRMDTPYRPEDAAVPPSSAPTSRRAYPVAITLLLVGGGLAAGSLFLPWWHFTFCDGSPDPGSAFTPALDYGLDDLRVW